MADNAPYNPTCVFNGKVEDTELEKFKKYINTKYGTKFETYWDFHEWSVKNYSNFWEEILIYFDVIYSGTYQKVAKTFGNMLNDTEWFIGAKMNYAENLLRHRDNKIALICADEEGNEEIFTFAQLYDQVKMYAAAFKQLGLQAGDMVACYMPNRQEAIFAMLGVVSLGGILGGPLPFYGIKGALNILKQMNPKFLITIDRFKYSGKEINILQNLSAIANDLESLKKIIVIPTKAESLTLNPLEIKNSCFLQEFLNYGKNSDGSYPDVSFLQFPFNHPISVCFTSGTTGSPKGIIHSAHTILSLLLFYGLHTDVSQKDVILVTHPVGWTIWNLFIFNLTLGAKIVLYNGDACLSKMSYWDLISKYKISHFFLPTNNVDNLERNGVIPRPDYDFKNLKMILVGSSPVKVKNANFLYKCIKHKKTYIGNFHGSTEVFPTGGYDFSMPAYIEEVQVPVLGLDLRCYNEQEQSVVGKIGELVVATPNPALPFGILNDKDKHKLKEHYFSKYNGVWNIHDEVWINPKTKGMIVLGRSDEVINQNGKRLNASDIYSIVHTVEEVTDYMCVGQNNSQTGETRCILFVIVKEGYNFSKELIDKIRKRIENDLTIYHVPEKILEIKEIPYNLNNKKMESLVKRIIATNEVFEVSHAINPDCLKYFVNIPELQNY